MRRIDLTSEQHTLEELLALAESDDLLIHSSSGSDYVLERADEFEREVASLERLTECLDRHSGD